MTQNNDTPHGAKTTHANPGHATQIQSTTWPVQIWDNKLWQQKNIRFIC